MFTYFSHKSIDVIGPGYGKTLLHEVIHVSRILPSCCFSYPKQYHQLNNQTWVVVIFNFGKGKENIEEACSVKAHNPKWRTSLPFLFHWSEHSHIATFTAREAGKCSQLGNHAHDTTLLLQKDGFFCIISSPHTKPLCHHMTLFFFLHSSIIIRNNV